MMDNPSDVVARLGGEVRDSEQANLDALEAEIRILRQGLRDSEDETARSERRLGQEMAARSRAERRAAAAEEALRTTETAIATAKRKALRDGAPLALKDEAPDAERREDFMLGIGRVGEDHQYPRVSAG